MKVTEESHKIKLKGVSGKCGNAKLNRRFHKMAEKKRRGKDRGRVGKVGMQN